MSDRIRFVMVETSHPGNIGSAARALKTMGFRQLVLVSPRFPDACTQPDAIAFASGANDVLESAHIVSTIQEAVSACSLVVSVSARLREFSPPVVSPRELVHHVSQLAEGDIAIVFGNERFGLPNEIVLSSQLLINIPANPEYSSLNLAQALQIIAYELSQLNAFEPKTDKTSGEIGFRGAMATAEQVDGMFTHLESALQKIEFLDANNPKKLMPRLKRLFARTQLEVEEVNIIRGISKKIIDRCG